jgi:hypothetical protein
MRQLGAITSQLLNLLFDKISSLFKEEGEYRVKEDFSLTLIWHQQDSLGDDIAQADFNTITITSNRCFQRFLFILKSFH